MTLEAGFRLGPYEVLSPLGAGGMGEVYRARDVRLEREVALKVLPAHLASDSSAFARLEREAKVLAALSHPNLVTIFDLGADAGRGFVVMELLRGETLRARVARSPVPWREAVEIALATAQGLEAAHAKGVVHGDLKPENVFLAGGATVKLLDFGLARFEAPEIDPKTQVVSRVTALAGTIHYLSPEQVKGSAADTRSDLFSFGSMLFEMLAGAPPFAGASAAEVMAAILRDPVPMAAPSLAVPPAVDQIVRACLHKDPAERIQTAGELVVALRSVAAGADSAPIPLRRRARRSKRIDSIAVLPFLDEDASPETDFVCDGVSERFIDTLSRVPDVRVTARASVFRYKGRAVDPRDAGSELGVRAVLTGSAARRGDAWTLRMELVDVLDGARLWAARHSVSEADLAGLPERAVEELSQALGWKRRTRGKAAEPSTRNSEAFRYYLQGRFYWNKRTRDGLFRSVDLFERAIQEDPSFALAVAGLADAYALLGGFQILPPAEAYSKARIEAARALALDPGQAEAHCSLGLVKYRFEWDWAGAEREFRLALEGNPGYATAHLWYGVFLALQGRFDEGLARVSRALAVDPLSLVVHWTYGYCYYYARRFEDALDMYRGTLAIDPTFARVHVDIGIIHALQGRFAAAVEEMRKAIALLEFSGSLLASLGWVYAVGGDRGEAEKILAELDARAKREHVSPFTLALIHVGLGEHDLAFERLEKSLEGREDALVSIRVNPRLDPLREDPRFTALVRRVGLA